MGVTTVHKQVKAFERMWQRCSDCYEGSDAVKARGQEYLPPLDSHRQKPSLYIDYQTRALYYNATGRTVDGLAGLIFQKAPEVEVPEALKDQLKDITLTSVPAELFALMACREVLKKGRYGVLVDMPTAEATEPRPYWVGFCADEIINWRTERINGDEVLTRVVLRQCCEESDPKDEFNVVETIQYRVLELIDGVYHQSIWVKAGATGAEWVKGNDFVAVRRGKPLDFIPFNFFGPTSIQPDVEKPPLLDLVDVNLSHYRTMADLEHGRHFVALPTPWVSGIAPGSESLSIGSGTAWVLDVNGQAGMLEFKGEGLGALEKADEQKRKLMATLGARLLEDQPSAAETATAVNMRHTGEHATLRTIAQALEQGLTLALRWHTWWTGTEDNPDSVDVEFELNKDFFTTKMTPEELKAWILALQADGVAFQTFYAALTKANMTRPGVEAEEEQKDIQEAIDARTPEQLVDFTGGPPQPGAPPSKPGAPPSKPGVPPAGKIPPGEMTNEEG